METTDAAIAFITNALDQIGVRDARGWARRVVRHAPAPRDPRSPVMALHAVWSLARSPMHSVSDDRLLAWTIAPSKPHGTERALTLRDAETGQGIELPSCPATGAQLLDALHAFPGHPVTDVVVGLHPASRERLVEDLRDTDMAMDRSLGVASQIEAHPSLGFFLREEARDGDRLGVRACLAMGADPWESDLSRNTALHHAAARGRTGIIPLLVEHGAQVNQTNALGQTPLHLAALGGHALTALALLGQGADVRARDRSGRTAFEISEARQRQRQREVDHARHP